jgi:hypothetical protein
MTQKLLREDGQLWAVGYAADGREAGRVPLGPLGRAEVDRIWDMWHHLAEECPARGQRYGHEGTAAELYMRGVTDMKLATLLAELELG